MLGNLEVFVEFSCMITTNVLLNVIKSEENTPWFFALEIMVKEIVKTLERRLRARDALLSNVGAYSTLPDDGGKFVRPVFMPLPFIRGCERLTTFWISWSPGCHARVWLALCLWVPVRGGRTDYGRRMALISWLMAVEGWLRVGVGINVF